MPTDYHSIEPENKLNQVGWHVHIRYIHVTKGTSETQNDANAQSLRRKSVSNMCMASWPRWAGNWRYIGIVRTTFALQPKVARYNLKRLVF